MINWSPRNIRLVRDEYGIDTGNPHVRAAFDAYIKYRNAPLRTEPRLSLEHLKHLVVGSALTYPVFDPNGNMLEETRLRYLDCAATKPMLVPSYDMGKHLDKRHNGPGRTSHHASESLSVGLKDGRSIVSEFVGGEETIFVPGASAGLNKIVRVLKTRFGEKAKFISSRLSHHSNLLPLGLMPTKQHLFFDIYPDGTYNMKSLEAAMIRAQAPKRRAFSTKQTPATIFVESQSNVTGYFPPVEQICRLGEKYNVRVVIDHTQGAANRQLDISEWGDNTLVVFSGHKIYAREGSGAIVGPMGLFNGIPDELGGGTVFGAACNTYLANPPESMECGTPAYVAQRTMVEAIRTICGAGMQNIERTEFELTGRLIERLKSVNGLRILGEPDIHKVKRGPVVSFTLDNPETGERLAPNFVGKALAYFYNVATRTGMFCANPYMYLLQGVSLKDAEAHAEAHFREGTSICHASKIPQDRLYGAIRTSIFFGTPQGDIDDLPRMLVEIQRMKAKHKYPTILVRPEQELAVGTCSEWINENDAFCAFGGMRHPLTELLEE